MKLTRKADSDTPDSPQRDGPEDDAGPADEPLEAPQGQSGHPSRDADGPGLESKRRRMDSEAGRAGGPGWVDSDMGRTPRVGGDTPGYTPLYTDRTPLYTGNTPLYTDKTPLFAGAELRNEAGRRP
jgi:hypothetical protein